jgi:hypothetical protein
MKKLELATMFLVTAVVLAAVLVQAKSDGQGRSERIEPKAAAGITQAPERTRQSPALTGSRQGYRLVTDVIDGFGGKSESSNYRIPVNSGGQSSPVGTSESDNWGAKAGFVYASRVKHGDANADGALDLGDAIYILNYLFKAGPDPCPMEAGDANCDGLVELGDAIYLLNYLFKGGPPPECP